MLSFFSSTFSVFEQELDCVITFNFAIKVHQNKKNLHAGDKRKLIANQADLANLAGYNRSDLGSYSYSYFSTPRTMDLGPSLPWFVTRIIFEEQKRNVIGDSLTTPSHHHTRSTQLLTVTVTYSSVHYQQHRGHENCVQHFSSLN